MRVAELCYELCQAIGTLVFQSYLLRFRRCLDGMFLGSSHDTEPHVVSVFGSLG